MKTHLPGSEFKVFFQAANLIERQLANDSLDVSFGNIFKVPNEDIEGDFNQPENTVDVKLLETVLQWIREQLNWPEDDLKIESKSGSKFISTKNIKNLIEFLENHLRNSNGIEISKDLTKLAFYTKDTADASNLSHKGIAVVQNYFAKKDKMRNDTFIGDSTDLIQAFNEFAKSNDGTKFSILYRTGAHWIPVQCEKRNGQFFIMEMDSLGTAKDQGRIIIQRAIMQSKLPQNKVTVLRAQNLRQTAGNNCAYFAMKDARRMQNNPDLVDELLKHEVAREKQENGLTYVKYLTPKEHMGSVQSKTRIKEYVTAYNKLHSEGKLATPVTESEILKISFEKLRKSDKSRVVDTGNSPQNKTILYFKDKFITSVVNDKVNSSSLKELAEIIETYSIHSITTQRLNQTAMVPRQNASVSQDRADPIVIVAPITPEKPEVKPARAKAMLSSTAKVVAPTIKAEAIDCGKKWQELIEKFDQIDSSKIQGFMTKSAYEKISTFIKQHLQVPETLPAQQKLLEEFRNHLREVNLANVKNSNIVSLVNDLRNTVAKLPSANPSQKKQIKT